MGDIRTVQVVKPICGFIFTKSVNHSKVIQHLVDVLGPVDDQTPVFDFVFTDYYEQEMGVDLKKMFLSFVKCIHPGDLAKIKIRTNQIEALWSVNNRRSINLDPGYLTGAKLVLASTKDFAHRIYLSDGIYGDVQLQYRHNQFFTSHWTYPDYQTDLALSFFHRVRKKYVQEESSR
ncbi:DUF4416 family protein [bacterium]|nr:DUF4416 family protein [bacterium]